MISGKTRCSILTIMIISRWRVILTFIFFTVIITNINHIYVISTNTDQMSKSNDSLSQLFCLESRTDSSTGKQLTIKSKDSQFETGLETFSLSWKNNNVYDFVNNQYDFVKIIKGTIQYFLKKFKLTMFKVPNIGRTASCILHMSRCWTQRVFRTDFLKINFTLISCPGFISKYASDIMTQFCMQILA